MKDIADPDLESPKISPSPQSHRWMYLAMLFAACCWAANIVAVKFALMGFAPIALAQVRCVAAAVVFGILFLAFRGRASLPSSGRDWLYVAAIGFCGITLNQMLFIEGISHTSVPHAAFVVAIEPIVVLVFSVLLSLESLTFLKSAGMMISLAGVLILTVGKAAPGNQAHWSGDVILLAQTVVFAVYTIMMKKVADKYDAITLNLMVYGFGAILMLPFGARAASRVQWSAIPAVAFGGLGFMILFSSVIGYLLFAFALTGLSAARVAAFNYVEPVIATVLGIWLLSDKLTIGVAAGGALILSGVYLAERSHGEIEANRTTA